MVRALVNHPNSSQTYLEFPEMTIIIMYETREVILLICLHESSLVPRPSAILALPSLSTEGLGTRLA